MKQNSKLTTQQKFKSHIAIIRLQGPEFLEYDKEFETMCTLMELNFNFEGSDYYVNVNNYNDFIRLNVVLNRTNTYVIGTKQQ